MHLRRPLPAVQGDTLHIVGVGDNRIGKQRATLAAANVPRPANHVPAMPKTCIIWSDKALIPPPSRASRTTEPEPSGSRAFVSDAGLRRHPSVPPAWSLGFRSPPTIAFCNSDNRSGAGIISGIRPASTLNVLCQFPIAAWIACNSSFAHRSPDQQGLRRTDIIAKYSGTKISHVLPAILVPLTALNKFR